MSAINLKLLQDSEIENFGDPKNINILMEEVRGLFDNYQIKHNVTGSPTQNKVSFGLNTSPVLPRNGANKSPPLQSSTTTTTSPTIGNRLNFNNNNSNTTTTNPTTTNNILKPSERLFKLNATKNNGTTSTTTSQQQTINNNLNIINHSNHLNASKPKNSIESSFIDVRKIGLKELSTLLTKRREGTIHIQAIKQIAELYRVACNSNSSKQTFLDEINKGTCLRSLLSYLSVAQPKFDSFEYNSQLESIKIISILTGNDSIKTFIKQTGDIPTLVQVLNWSHKLDQSYNTFNMNLISLISNLATQESCASVLRKAGAISPIFSISTNEQISNELRIIALNTLIIFSSYSDPKISEAIVDSKISLELIFKNIVSNSITNSKIASANQLCNKFLDLLYQVSDCPKTRAIAFECGIENLTSLIRIDSIYPIELNRVNFFRISNVTSNPTIPDQITAQTNFQSKVLSCLEKLSKHDSNRMKIGISSTTLILSFLTPCFKIPKEVFRWNTTMLERVLKLAIPILQDDNCKQLFLENDGCKSIVWMMTQCQNSDEISFSSSVLLSCAQVLGCVVTPNNNKKGSNPLQISLVKIMDSDIIPSLMKLYKSYPDEKSLQLLMCKVFKHLGSIDDNKQIIFSEGGYQLLHNLLNNQDTEVVSHSLDSLAVLSTHNFIRKVLRLLGTVQIIIEKVSLQNSVIQKSAILNLYNISIDSEGFELLSNLPTSILNSLLYGNESDIQISVVLMIENLISFDENYLEKFISDGGVSSLMNSLYSNNEKLQFQVLNLLNRIIQNANAQVLILNSGIVNKLKSLATHENVVKQNSTLIDPMRQFIIAVKTIPQPEPVVAVEEEKPIQKQTSTPNVSPPSVLKKEKSANILIGNRNQSVPVEIIQPPQPIVQPIPLPDFKKIGAVLSKLNEEQLRDVIIELIKQNTQLSEILPPTIRGVITGNKLPFPTVSTTPPPSPTISLSVLSTSGSISAPPAPPPPPPSTTSKSPSPFSPSQFTNVQLKSTNHVKKEPTLSSHSGGVISSNDLLNSPVFLKRENNPSPMPILGKRNEVNSGNNHTNSNNSPFSNLMNELQNKVKTNTMKLQHIDTNLEIENRRKDRLMEKNVGILKDIVNNATKRNAIGGKQSRKLIDSSVIQGMKFWKQSFDLYKQTLVSIFKRYDVFAILVFKILDSIEDFSFKEALEITGFTDNDLLSQQLLRIGFNLKSSTYVIRNDSSDDTTNATEEIEYNSIIKPTGIPVKLILQLIMQQISQ